ncbi:MAG: hypothetical protein E7046_04855 [Lentisphaerae bacterium]|nr:hypothetical protein [Lentisphaerota bacterium]
MANDLLANFKAASGRYNHVVFNDRTQQFERAGKRHAIATFFGTAEAKAKNNLTLTKIKEALSAEVAEGGRFHGAKANTNGLFDSVDGEKRIKSATIRSIIKEFKREARKCPDVLSDMKNAAVKAIAEGSEPLSAEFIDRHVAGWKAFSVRYAGTERAVVSTMVRMMLMRQIDGNTMESSIDLLQKVQTNSDGMGIPGKVASGLYNFFMLIHQDAASRDALFEIMTMAGREGGSARLEQVICCELACIAADCRDSAAVRGALTQLLARLKDDASPQNMLVAMTAVPVELESYGVALDFCSSGPEVNKLLLRLPVENRIPILSAMKTFGDSRDMILMHRLVGVQDRIRDLHAYGNMTPEAVFRAIEGETAQLPECIAAARNMVASENGMAEYCATVAAEKMEKAFADRGWSLEKMVLAQADGLRLMRTFGISVEEAIRIADEMSAAKYAVFTGERRNAVLELRAIFGDSFDGLPSAVKYNLLAAPPEYRESLAEAFKLVKDGAVNKERAFHFLAMRRNEMKDLWDAGRLTAENILKDVANGLGTMVDRTTEWTFENVIEQPLQSVADAAKDVREEGEEVSNLDVQFETMLDMLVFEYNLGSEEARAFLRPHELEGMSVGIPISETLTHINPHYQVIGPEFGVNPDGAVKQLSNDMNREPYRISIVMPGHERPMVFEPGAGVDDLERAGELKEHCEEIKSLVTALCGEDNGEQIAMTLLGMSQAMKLLLLPYAIRNGFDRVSDAFSLQYEISAGENGDVKLRVYNKDDSRLSIDWTITIHPDGVHEVTVPEIGPNIVDRIVE